MIWHMTWEWQPSFKRHVNRNEDLFVLNFFIWLTFSVVFISFLVYFKINFL